MPWGSSDNFCMIGRANARVFPLPVFAAPMQSLPLRICGMQFAWTGVGVLMPEERKKVRLCGKKCKQKLTNQVTLTSYPWVQVKIGKFRRCFHYFVN